MGKKKEKLGKIPSSAESDREQPTVIKPQKEKRKSTMIPSFSEEPSTDGEPSSKKPKQDEPSDITAGTTLDQALLANPALKLNKKPKRAKKREKHAKLEEDRKQKAKEREKEECRQYLQTWNDCRDKWKFQKLKQIYVVEHVFDEDYLGGDIWPVALEYLSGTRGSGRDSLTKRAEEVIRELDKQVKESGDDSLLDGSRYQRARELLQYLG